MRQLYTYIQMLPFNNDELDTDNFYRFEVTKHNENESPLQAKDYFTLFGVPAIDVAIQQLNYTLST